MNGKELALYSQGEEELVARGEILVSICRNNQIPIISSG